MISRTKLAAFLAGLALVLPGVARLDYAMSTTGFSAQEMSFTSPDGQSVPVSGMSGKVVVLMFSGVQDPQCKDELKALAALSDRYQNQPVSIYWVSINTTAEAGNDKLARPCGVTTPVRVLRLTDVNSFKKIKGRALSLPTLIVLNKQGQPYGQPRSGFNPNSDFVNDIAELVDSLLAQK